MHVAGEIKCACWEKLVATVEMNMVSVSHFTSIPFKGVCTLHSSVHQSLMWIPLKPILVGLANLCLVNLNSVPTIDWVLLDLASPTRGRILAALTAACLQTHLASRQEKL
jgi:hypothetical protein